MVVALTVGFFLVTLTILAGLGYWLWDREPATAAPASVPAPELGREQPARGTAGLPEWLRFLAEVGSIAPVSIADRAKTRQDLTAAGYRDESSVQVFYGLKVAALAGIPLVTAVALYALQPELSRIGPAVLMSAYLGFRLPEWVLKRRVDSRIATINRSLPDLLDLLVISVESGLSLEHALTDTARDLKMAHPVVSEELAVFQLETQAGTSRTEALRNLGRRTREPEMRKLTALLIQAERFGSSISRVLRTQARYMRMRRRQRAEELAHKVGVKLIFPIFFLIMPSVFLVTAGPAVLFLMNNLGNLVGP